MVFIMGLTLSPEAARPVRPAGFPVCRTSPPSEFKVSAPLPVVIGGLAEPALLFRV